MKLPQLLLAGFCFVLIISTVTAESPLNLSGSWSEDQIECYMFSGIFTNTTSESDYWNITQHGNLITGTNTFYNGKTVVEEPIAGVISPDGKLVNVVDTSGGTYVAYITDENTLTINYLNTGEKKEKEGYAFAFHAVMKRNG
jgi:hypothetical protein